MDVGRKSLPHELPLWIDVDGAAFFITCCAKDRTLSPLAYPKTAAGLLESIPHRLWPSAFGIDGRLAGLAFYYIA